MSKRLQRSTHRPQLPLPPLAGPGRLVYAADPMTGVVYDRPATVESVPGHRAAPVRMRWERLPEYLDHYGLRVAEVIQCLGAETILVAVSAETPTT